MRTSPEVSAGAGFIVQCLEAGWVRHFVLLSGERRLPPPNRSHFVAVAIMQTLSRHADSQRHPLSPRRFGLSSGIGDIAASGIAPSFASLSRASRYCA